jgi:hypothetical protein
MPPSFSLSSFPVWVRGNTGFVMEARQIPSNMPDRLVRKVVQFMHDVEEIRQ